MERAEPEHNESSDRASDQVPSVASPSRTRWIRAGLEGLRWLLLLPIAFIVSTMTSGLARWLVRRGLNGAGLADDGGLYASWQRHLGVGFAAVVCSVTLIVCAVVVAPRAKHGAAVVAAIVIAAVAVWGVVRGVPAHDTGAVAQAVGLLVGPVLVVRGLIRST